MNFTILVFLTLIFGGCSNNTQDSNQSSSRGSSNYTFASKKSSSNNSSKNNNKYDEEFDSYDEDYEDERYKSDYDEEDGSGALDEEYSDGKVENAPKFNANNGSYSAQMGSGVLPEYNDSASSTVECYEDEGQIKVYNFTTPICITPLTEQEKAMRVTSCTQEVLSYCAFDDKMLKAQQMNAQYCEDSNRQAIPLLSLDCCKPVMFFCDGPFSEQSVMSSMSRSDPSDENSSDENSSDENSSDENSSDENSSYQGY